MRKKGSHGTPSSFESHMDDKASSGASRHRRESVIPNDHLDLEHSVTAATIMTMMGIHPGAKYFLVVVAGKVQVLFGLAQCFALV
jgi:hypothetical protein